jgi:hypothetical protein
LAAALLAGGLAGIAAAETPGFKQGQPGQFTFDTGALKGALQVTEKVSGLVSLVDTASGTELAKGKNSLGFLQYYRLLSPNRRWGTIIWEWRKSARLQDDGSVRVDWPAEDDHPCDLSGIFRWSAPGVLDLETVITPRQDMLGLELFIGSYMKDGAKSFVYVAPAKYGGGEPGFLPTDVCPLTVGTYLAFPRDLAAARIVYDGRWEQGLHPVQWSIARYLAAPIAYRHDEKTGLSMVLMSRPQDCFSIECSYNQEPPDGVGGHYSTYLSLFGRDVKAGQPERAHSRLVVGKGLTPSAILAAYEQFLKDKK